MAELSPETPGAITLEIYPAIRVALEIGDATVDVMTDAFYTNQTVPVRMTFRERDTDSLVDPTEIRVVVESPSPEVADQILTLANGDLTRNSLGVFSVELEPNLPGKWDVRVESDGTAKAIAQASFYVRRSNV